MIFSLFLQYFMYLCSVLWTFLDSPIFKSLSIGFVFDTYQLSFLCSKSASLSTPWSYTKLIIENIKIYLWAFRRIEITWSVWWRPTLKNLLIWVQRWYVTNFLFSININFTTILMLVKLHFRLWNISIFEDVFQNWLTLKYRTSLLMASFNMLSKTTRSSTFLHKLLLFRRRISISSIRIFFSFLCFLLLTRTLKNGLYTVPAHNALNLCYTKIILNPNNHYPISSSTYHSPPINFDNHLWHWPCFPAAFLS